MRLFLAIICSILLLGCIKEDSTDYEAFLVNQSNHQVLVLPYKHGGVRKEDTMKLAPGDTIQIANGSHWGKSNKGGFTSEKLTVGSDDSVIVLFDRLYSVTHYANLPANVAEKYLPFISTRNLGNPDSYIYEYYDKNKHARYQKYTYIFTEADYDYASH